MGKYKHDHMDDDLKEVHWLEVKKRILFKIGLLVYKSLNGQAPVYLQELIRYTSNYGHNVWLFVPQVNSKYGSRAFSIVGPKFYNLLPFWVTEAGNIDKFKSCLKKFLFDLDLNDFNDII